MDLSGELARTLLELAPDATVVVDARGIVVFANAQVEQTFGYRAAEIVGSSVETLLPERFRADPAYREHFAAQPTPWPMGGDLALHGRHKDGHEFPVEVSLSPVAASTGPLVVAAVRDATVTHDRQQQLTEENLQKSRFLAAASHDLRQPLQTLNLLNRAARKHAGRHSALLGILERQQRALDSMSALLAAVLDISKLESGALEPHPEVHRVDEIFTRLRSSFEAQAADKGLRLVIDHCRHGVLTDAELLHRLLANLVSNAIRYTARGEVHVRCTRRGPKLDIEVRDTGIGIPPDQLERVFEEFYQVDRGSERPEGLGLGLSIVRWLAELLHCKVTVESVVDQGSTFSVIADAAEIAHATAVGAEQEQFANTGCVLIVDDEREVAEATSLLLELEGYDVCTASSEREAVERALARSPDLIVSDYQLRGGETGVGVVKSIRDRTHTVIPVIFVTGDTAQAAIANSKIDNATLLNKPVRGDDLIAVVRRSIATRRRIAAG